MREKGSEATEIAFILQFAVVVWYHSEYYSVLSRSMLHTYNPTVTNLKNLSQTVSQWNLHNSRAYFPTAPLAPRQPLSSNQCWFTANTRTCVPRRGLPSLVPTLLSLSWHSPVLDPHSTETTSCLDTPMSKWTLPSVDLLFVTGERRHKVHTKWKERRYQYCKKN